MCDEIWKDIPNYEGLYKVSNYGRILSCKKNLIKSTCICSGYVLVDLYKDGIKSRFLVHRLVALCFVDGFFEGAEVNHKDLNKENNYFKNLEWVTRQENQIHQHKMHNTNKKITYCSKCGNIITKNSKLCLKCRGLELRKVNNRPSKEELLELIKTKSFLEIGRMYNVSDNAIRKWCKSYNLPYKKKDIKKML